jgi:2-dehydro-3-deoxyphosphogalactonate aldolase
VPLNSPEPLKSVRLLRDALDGRAVVGAGTVLSPAAVTSVVDAGGQIVISPNTDAEVIRATKAAGLLSMPGFFTPSEAFLALKAGADVLKLFPAEVAGVAGLRAVLPVLPLGVRVYAVGGVDPDSVPRWVAAGASGFGLGSAIFKPGRTAQEAGAGAAAFVAAWKSRLG